MKAGTFALVRVVVGLTVLASCSVPRKAYVVRLSASNPGVARLCSAKKATKTEEAAKEREEHCVEFTGRAEDGKGLSGTVAVTITDIDASKTYTLEKERKTVGGFSDASGFLTLVFQRAFALTGSMVDSLLPADARNKLDDPDVKAATQSVKAELEGWLGKRDTLGVALARAMKGRTEATPRAPADLFKPYYDPAKRALKKRDVPADATYMVFGTDSMLPPPRAQEWSADRELAWLTEAIGAASSGAEAVPDAVAKQVRTTVTEHLTAYCAPASFGPTAKDAFARLTGGVHWAEYVKTHQIDKERIAAALGVTNLGHLRDVLAGQSTLDFAKRVEDAEFAGAPTPEQDALAYAIVLGRLHRYAARCRTNVGVALTAFAGKADVSEDLQALAKGLDSLLAATESAADIVERTIQPLIVRTVTDLVEGGATTDNQVTFGPFDIEGGETKMIVKRKDTDGEHDVASLTAHGDESILGLGFTLGAGFAVSRCDECNVEIAEHVDTAEPGMAAVRVFEEERSSTAFEPVVTGQLDLLSCPNLSVGLVFGIPLDEAPGREHTVITGIGVRIRDRAQVAVGIEWFETRDLPGSGDGERVELTDPEDQVLTSQQVSSSETEAALVIAITFARDLL
jgi:hypothetical protein